MATINTSTIFPSTKFISTDANGDLQEVVSSPQTNGSITHDGLTFTLVNAGELSPAPSLEIKEDTGVTGIEFSASGNSIVMSVQSIAGSSATFDSLSQDGYTISAENAGDTGLLFEVLESQIADGITYDSGTSTISVSLDDLATNKTQGDLASIIAQSTAQIRNLIDISITNSATALSVTGSNALDGGNDAVPATTIASYTQSQVQTAFSGADASVTAIASLSVADSGANLVSGLSATNYNGAEAVVGNLDVNADYILLKRTDLHDLADSEKDDGRKFMWGLVHQAESIFRGLSDAPENFTLTKGNPISTDNGTSLRQTYTIQAKYGIADLDLKGEA